MYRSIPAVSQWCSKRTKPCLDDVSATTVQGMRVNVDWLKAKTILHLNIRVQSTDSNNPDHNLEVHQSKLALRIMGKSNLWSSTSLAIGSMTSSLAQSMLPYNLGKPNQEDSQVKWIKIDNANGPATWDIHLSLELNMKKTTLHKKSKLILQAGGNNVNVNLQIESTPTTSNKRMPLLSVVLPLQCFVDASSTNENNTQSVEAKESKEAKETKIETENLNLDFAAMQDATLLLQERGNASDYTDMRDAFALTFVEYFLRIVFDMIHLSIAVLVMCIAPWRFIGLLFILCEPKRRYPIRISSKLISKIYNSMDLDEETAYDMLVLYGNNYSKTSTSMKYNSDGGTTHYNSAVPQVQHFQQPLETAKKKNHWKHTCDPKRKVSLNHTTKCIKQLNQAEKKLKTHEKKVNKIFKLLNKLSPPYMNELKIFIKLRDQRLHYVALHMHLNRARLCNLFPPNGLKGDEDTTKYQEHESLPCLFELNRTSQIEHERQIDIARKNLVSVQTMYEEDGLKTVRCKKWGVWHKTEALCRSLSRYMLVAGLMDWVYILLNLLLLVTLYKIPSLCTDFTKIPRMTTTQAWCKFFSLSGR